MKKINFILFLLLSISGLAQNTGSLPYWSVMLPKSAISGTDSCAVFDNATLKWKKTNCSKLGDSLYVKKHTGNVLFDFSGASTLELTTDNGGYAQSYLYMDYAAAGLGNENGYIDIGGSSNINLSSRIDSASTVNIRTGVNNFYAKLAGTNLTGGRNFEFPDASGTLALTSDITDIGDSIYVKKKTGNVLFKYYDNTAFDLTNDNSGYTLGSLYMDSTSLQLAFNEKRFELYDDFVSLINVSTGQSFFFPINKSTDTLALLSDVENTTSTKLDTALASGKLLIGQSYGGAAAKTPSLNSSAGSFSMSNTGIFTYPDASGSGRGFLNSTDWTTFNNKQAALVSGTNIKTVAGTSLLGSGDLGIITGTYGGTGVNNGASTLTYGANTTITGGGTIGLGGFTLTVPATGTAALLGTANVFTANQAVTFSSAGDNAIGVSNTNSGVGARAYIYSSNGTASLVGLTYGTNFSGTGLIANNLTSIQASGSPGILYSALTSTNYHRWAIGGTAAGNQIMNLLTTGLSLTPTTLTDGTNALSVTATMPTTITATRSGVEYNITSAGSSSQGNRGMTLNYLAGYTGNSATAGIVFTNATAGTGASLSGGISNSGMAGGATGTTVGYNIGGRFVATNGNLSVGVAGFAPTAKNSATNIGGAFFANNSGTSPIHVGVYAGLNTTDPTFISGALIADNASTTDPIFVGRDNGTAVITFGDGGKITLASTNTAGGTTGDQTINKASGTVNIAASGTTVTVTNSLVTTASIVYAVVRTNDSTALIKNVVPGSGSFVINMNAAVTTETSIGFFVIN